MADFNPRQLDQLEDALESLEEIDDLESLELSPALTERIGEYQDVLALCREAFPSEEPREDLLVDVFAEAQAVSRRPKLREAGGGRWRRFWERWRGSLIPGIALAGTAAAVLLLLEPERELERGEDRLAQSEDQNAERERADHRTEDTGGSPSEPASEPGVDEDGDDEAESEPELDSDEAGEDAGTEPAASDLNNAAFANDPPDSGGASPSSKKSKPRKNKTSKAAEPELEPTPEPMTKDETWTTLERANADRRKGACDRARSRYEQVIAASSDALAVARAKAGIGLCLEQERRAAEAGQWFDDARGSNPGIDAWINSQRDEQPLPGEKKKHRKKAAPVQALESSQSL